MLFFILLPISILISSVSAVYLWDYCKTRKLKRQETQVNNAAMAAGSGARQSVCSVYFIPTTNQLMQMYMQHANITPGQSRANEPALPPDYGQGFEKPPTYEEAILRADRY